MTVLPPPTGSTSANIRIGWSQISGDLQAPCGFDGFSYSFRMNPSTVFHQSVGTEYGKGYKIGDVVGCMINFPRSSESEQKENQGDLEDDECDPLPDAWDPGVPYEPVKFYGPRPKFFSSQIRFFVNGEDQGVAFTNIYKGTYTNWK